MNHRLIHFIAFGCFGMTTEIFFTALSDLFGQVAAGGGIDWSLAGHSYVWMFPIYGSAAILFPIFFPLVARLLLFVRLSVYMIGIFFVEYLTGWLLDVTTGSCPWHYDTALAVHGYIRLDYGPFWMVFGLVIERLFLFLDSRFPLAKP